MVKDKLMTYIQTKMAPILSDMQFEELQSVLTESFHGIEVAEQREADAAEIDKGFDLLQVFLSAKQIEGRSTKTLRYYEATARKMLAEVRKPVRDICTEDLRFYLTKYQERGARKTTIDNMRRIFSSFLGWLEAEGYILKNPVHRIGKIKADKVVKEVFSCENLEVLRDFCTERRDLAIVDLLASTGMRVGELVQLNRTDMKYHEMECVVKGKGNSERVVYFDARTTIHLLTYLATRTDTNPALFVSFMAPHNRLLIGGVEARLHMIGKRANLSGVHPHKFRRTLATRAIDKGMPIEQVQKLLGHVRIDTTMQYAMVSQTNVKNSHRKYMN